METFIITGIIGVIIIVIGCFNRKGDISTLHWYHRQRVTEESRKPYGKQVGLGMMIMGIVTVVFGISAWIQEAMDVLAVLIAGASVLAVGYIAGIAIMIHAMFKYNKGIF